MIGLTVLLGGLAWTDAPRTPFGGTETAIGGPDPSRRSIWMV